METYKESPGEAGVRRFLQENKIDFIPQKKIFLKNDSKKFRVADFYLPKYKIFLEYNGGWNNPERKEEYGQKRASYRENDVKFMELYPRDLNYLSREYFFQRLNSGSSRWWINFRSNHLKEKIYVLAGTLSALALVLINRFNLDKSLGTFKMGPLSVVPLPISSDSFPEASILNFILILIVLFSIVRLNLIHYGKKRKSQNHS